MPGRKAQTKCIKCAALHIDQVHQIHGCPKTDPKTFVRDPNVPSDGCYDPKKCPSKRSYLSNPNRLKQNRAIKTEQDRLERLQIDIEPSYAKLVYATLIVYREAGYDSIMHAIGASIWRGTEQIGEIQPIHCDGMTPKMADLYVKRILDGLNDRYGIRYFSNQMRLEPSRCPIHPCYYHFGSV